ncbi:hypothetical protein OXX59_008795, partial [Metschnikowia pulcherrima]
EGEYDDEDLAEETENLKITEDQWAAEDKVAA